MQIGRFVVRSGGISSISEGTHVLSTGEIGYAVDNSTRSEDIPNNSEDIVYIGTDLGDKQLLTRVKGNAEIKYRSGDVNITKADIGLDKVDNTADVEKSVLEATRLTSYGGDASTPIYIPESNQGKPTPVTSIKRSLLTGTYDISITGNANTATVAETANKLNPVTDQGDQSTPVYFASGVPAVVTSIKRSLLIGDYDINITGNAATSSECTGNSATATKARYILTNAAVGGPIRPVYVRYDQNNARGEITACNIAASGAYKNFIPAVDTNGVMEVGNVIDMHTPTGTSDYDVRLTATAGALNCSGTFTASKVFNAVWNDYADALLKENIEEDIKCGMIVAINPKTKMYKAASKNESNLVVGVSSDSYGHLLGGRKGMSEEEILKEYVPVAVAGNVKVYVIGKIKAGDLITVSKIDGIGKKASRWFHKPGTIVGKALASSDNKGLKKVLMQVSLM